MLHFSAEVEEGLTVGYGVIYRICSCIQGTSLYKGPVQVKERILRASLEHSAPAGQ
jgi:hypothetical protein